MVPRSLGAGRADTGGGAEQEPGHRGATALGLLILPVIIIATQALRSVPAEIVKDRWRSAPRRCRRCGGRPCPQQCRASPRERSWRCRRRWATAPPPARGLVFVSYDPNGLLSGYTTMPIQIFNWTGRPQEEFRVLAAAASIVLLVLLLAMNGLAIYIRNHFQRRW